VTLIAGGDYLLGGWNGIVPDGFKQTRFTTPVTNAANASSLEVVNGKLTISSLPAPAQDELRKAVSLGVDVHVAGAALRAEERAQLAEVAKSANLSDEAMPIFQKVKSPRIFCCRLNLDKPMSTLLKKNSKSEWKRRGRFLVGPDLGSIDCNQGRQVRSSAESGHWASQLRGCQWT
jgi:hypothetical protein